MVAGFEAIIYISCNPHTGGEPGGTVRRHRIEQFALFDQFPYRPHGMRCFPEAKTGSIEIAAFTGLRRLTWQRKLSPAEVEQRLQALPDWVMDRHRLYRLFVFTDFVEAFGL